MSEFVSAVAGAPSDLTDNERAALLQLAVSVTVHGRALVAISRGDLAALLIDEEVLVDQVADDELDTLEPHFQLFYNVQRSHGLD
jgi:hypothetical protein